MVHGCHQVDETESLWLVMFSNPTAMSLSGASRLRIIKIVYCLDDEFNTH